MTIAVAMPGKDAAVEGGRRIAGDDRGQVCHARGLSIRQQYLALGMGPGFRRDDVGKLTAFVINDFDAASPARTGT